MGSQHRIQATRVINQTRVTPLIQRCDASDPSVSESDPQARPPPHLSREQPSQVTTRQVYQRPIEREFIRVSERAKRLALVGRWPLNSAP